jgi:hypothetical protein
MDWLKVPERRIHELLAQSPQTLQESQQLIREDLKTYGQTETEHLYLLLLAEKMQQEIEKLQRQMPEAPEFALYQFLLLSGFSQQEMRLINIDGQPTPQPLEEFFAQELSPRNEETDKVFTAGRNSILPGHKFSSSIHRKKRSQRQDFFLATDLQGRSGFLKTSESSYSFPILNNFLFWGGKRHRWRTHEAPLNIKSRHLKRFLTSFFPSSQHYSIEVEANKIMIRDLESKSDFNLNLKVAACIPKKQFKRFLEQDLVQIRQLQELSLWLRQQKFPAETMLNQLISQKEGHLFLRYRQMPHIFIKEVEGWEEVYKSPFSYSFYNMAGKSWDETPAGICRISDHWNFESHGKIHGKTDRTVPKGYWALGHYCPLKQYYQLRQIRPPDQQRLQAFDQLCERINQLRSYTDL